ncbi:helix-turn-helix domain-containing protein [Angustibacter luteus]|uniref:Helix-turn-helix domain-containing protein n=1 Tax=Angustibacter luteus TaxID=658456 RepID=A0ABW1JEY2_9ACTN
MDDLTANVADNIKRLRQARGLSLAQLSARSGVAKSTLSQIEAGSANPTLGTLTALGGALSSSVPELITAAAASREVLVVPRGSGTDISDDAIAGFLVQSTTVQASLLEFHSLTLKRGHSEVSAGHGPGAREHVLVVSGSARLGPEESSAVVSAGDYATYPADGPHVWQAVKGKPAAVWVVALYPDRDA